MNSPDDKGWPPTLRWADWRETCATLHLWTQVVGKVRLALAPPANHWWQVALYVTSRGLTTSPMPHGHRTVQMDFDFIDHVLTIQTSDGAQQRVGLYPRTVANFYAEVMERLHSLGLEVGIWTKPVELPSPIPFELDHEHCTYDRSAVLRFWQMLVQSDRVLKVFRSGFLGKASLVHFFWGSFDLATTRFSGRQAPSHPSVPNTPDHITLEAYSHECSSCGFWPGGPGMEEPVFYAYAYPEPPGFAEAPVAPSDAFYSRDFGEFILPYEMVRASPSPAATLLAFLQTTYEAAANGGRWDRAALERPSPGRIGIA